MTNKIEEYTQDIVHDFVSDYLSKLDENIKQMLEAFGFKEDIEKAPDWLLEHDMDVLMDENKVSNESVKVIYLVKSNSIIAWFGVKIYGEENLTYSFTDVYVKNEDLYDE